MKKANTHVAQAFNYAIDVHCRKFFPYDEKDLSDNMNQNVFFWCRENGRRLKDNRITQSHPSCTLKAKCSIPLFRKRLAIGFNPIKN